MLGDAAVTIIYILLLYRSLFQESTIKMLIKLICEDMFMDVNAHVVVYLVSMAVRLDQLKNWSNSGLIHSSARAGNLSHIISVPKKYILLAVC